MAEAKIALLKQLLEAGVHFGHKKNRWNPKMKPYIFGARNGVYIIDLQKTAESIESVSAFFRQIVSEGGKVLFVGTKKQAKDIVKEAAEKTGMFYVNERWLGGMLTNFQTVRNSINRLIELEKMRDDGTFDVLSKKEVSQLTKEMNKLAKNLNGVREMKKLPQALFIIDVKTEEIALKEATKLSIPVVGIVDTNSNPDGVDFVIPGNDDAIKSVKAISDIVVEAVAEAREIYVRESKAKEAEEAKEAQEKAAKEAKEAKKAQSAAKKSEKSKRAKTPEQPAVAPKADSGEGSAEDRVKEIEQLADEALQQDKASGQS